MSNELGELYGLGMQIMKNQKICEDVEEIVKKEGYNRVKNLGLPSLMLAFYNEAPIRETKDTFEDLVEKYNINSLEQEFWTKSFNNKTSWFNQLANEN